MVAILFLYVLYSARNHPSSSVGKGSDLVRNRSKGRRFEPRTCHFFGLRENKKVLGVENCLLRAKKVPRFFLIRLFGSSMEYTSSIIRCGKTRPNVRTSPDRFGLVLPHRLSADHCQNITSQQHPLLLSLLPQYST